MRYEARLTAYDMLDQIQVSVVLYVTDDDDPTSTRKAFSYARQQPSRGESEPRLWVIQLLQEALRDLQATEKRAAHTARPPVGPHTVSGVAESR